MLLNRLKNRIRNIEAALESDRTKIQMQTRYFVSQFKEAKNTLFLSELLLGSFAVGYLLGPSSASANPKGKKITGLILFAQLNRYVKRFLKGLFIKY